MRLILLSASVLALAACGDTKPAEPAPVAEAPAAVEHAAHDQASIEIPMTPADPGGFTQDDFTFHTKPGVKHIVRLEAPGTDTWKATSTGEPTVKPAGERRETTGEGKAALVLEYEMLQAGTVSIVFQRLEDGKVEATRTIMFMVH